MANPMGSKTKQSRLLGNEGRAIRPMFPLSNTSKGGKGGTGRLLEAGGNAGPR